MADTSSPDTSSAAAPTAPVDTVAPDWSAGAAAALDSWADTYTRESPLSRATDKYNAVYSALETIRSVLAEL